MTTTKTADVTNWAKPLLSILLGVTLNLAFGLALGSVPTQAQLYAASHAVCVEKLALLPSAHEKRRYWWV